MKKHWIISIGIIAAASGPSCAQLKNALAINDAKSRMSPIANPFDSYPTPDPGKQNIILRTKKGDRSVEVEFPGNQAAMTDFVVPLSPSFKESGTGQTGAGYDPTQDERYKERAPSITDREITSNLPQGKPEDEEKRRDIESGLGVQPSEESAPNTDRSYLATLDHVKSLYHVSRFEAALLELDEMVRTYSTDAHLYEMRGTLLDRLGRTDLAIKSWNQAIRLNPGNSALRRYVEHKSKTRSLASP